MMAVTMVMTIMYVYSWRERISSYWIQAS